MLRGIRYVIFGFVLAMLTISMAGIPITQAGPGIDFSSLLNIVKPGVVFIVTQTAEENKVSTGSGFIIREDGSPYVITNFHVVDAALEQAPDGTFRQVRRIEVWLPDPARNFQVAARDEEGRVVPYDARLATIVGGSPPWDEGGVDVAVLDIGPVGRQVWWGNSATIASGDTIFVLGYPRFDDMLNIGGTINLNVTWGFITTSYSLLPVPGPTILQMEASINAGNSGGPVFNTEGKIIGIATAELAPDINDKVVRVQLPVVDPETGEFVRDPETGEIIYEWTIVYFGLPEHRTDEQFELALAGNVAQLIVRAMLEAAEQAKEEEE
jgi:serine protease Do